MQALRFTLLCVVLGVVLTASAVATEAGWQQISPADRRGISPEIAVGPDGTVHLIWLDKGLVADRPPPKPRKPGEHSHRSSTNLYYSQSRNGGDSWSTPKQVNKVDGAVWGFQVSKPRIAVGKSRTIHIFFPGNEWSEAAGKDTVTARYMRSTDNGDTFSDPVTLHAPAGFDQANLLGEGLAATFSFGTMGLAPDGSVIAAWQDVRGMVDSSDGADAYVAISRDDGKSFTAERRALAGGDVCPCCQLTMAFGDGTTLLGYRHIYDDGRDSSVAVSTDGGETFTSVARMPVKPWKIDGCPLKPTALAVDGDTVYAAAYSAGPEPAGVYLSRSDDGGRTFADATQLHPGAAYSDAPCLTVGADGRLRAVWQAKTGGDRRLYMAESAPDGGALSGPRELPAPDGNASYPVTAVGQDGTLYVAWQHAGERVLLTRIAPDVSQAAAR
jgi:hypothetical protein